MRRGIWSAGVAAAVALAGIARPTWAEFTNHDGYTADGKYQVSAEITPYLYLPATSANLQLAHFNGYTVSASTPVPSISQLTNVLDAAVLADGLVRYGPWSAELNFWWINASASKTRPIADTGASIHLNESSQLLRISPGLGVQFVRSELFGAPVSADLRAGFTSTTTGASANPARSAIHGLNSTGSFVQPWMGLRGDIYPSPKWRIELGAQADGIGIDGVWGWSASLTASYLITKWLDVSIGFAALNTQRSGGLDRQRGLNLTGYGPVAGVGFRF